MLGRADRWAKYEPPAIPSEQPNLLWLLSMSVPEKAESIRHRESSTWQNRLLVCHKRISFVSCSLYNFKWVFGIVLVPELTELIFQVAFCCKLAGQDVIVLYKTSDGLKHRTLRDTQHLFYKSILRNVQAFPSLRVHQGGCCGCWEARSGD